MHRGSRPRRHLDRWSAPASRVAGCLFLIALPIGYAPDSSDSTDFLVGIYGGGGQVASVLRDCSGESLHSEASTFRDVSGSASYRFTLNENVVSVLGLRTGYWESTAGFSAQTYDPIGYARAPDTSMSFGYINPHVSLESRNIGLGLGYIFGDAIHEFSREPEAMRISGHLRLGSPRKACFLLSVGESTPLISGGGLVQAGFGYPLGGRSYGFSGVSGGFYDRLGFSQHLRFRVNRSLALDIGGRAGGAGGKFEGSVFGGLVLHVGHGVHIRPAPKEKASPWDALP